jgi:hypothetical protein
MTERRQHDRRVQDADVAVERRHGERRTYQAGCTSGPDGTACTLCRAAEAAYRANLRQRHLKGLPVLGLLVSPVEARRRVRQLKLEGYTAARIAAMAGWRNGHLQFGDRERIRLLTLLRIRRVAHFAMLEGVESDVVDPLD